MVLSNTNESIITETATTTPEIMPRVAPASGRAIEISFADRGGISISIIIPKDRNQTHLRYSHSINSYE